MKARPILFSGAMVRAILAGTKTQTRRIVKGSPTSVHWNPVVVAGYGGWVDDHGRPCPCPYGKPGDRLWVKETHCYYSEANEIVCAYRADEWTECPADDGKWKPSIFCTRVASRITLEITGVRVERLQDISEADAQAEGCERPELSPRHMEFAGTRVPVHPMTGEYRDAYRSLWESINGAGSWAANPWVWVIEFRRVA